jgi:hypothetical protein
MTLDEAQKILDAAFEVCDYIDTLHLTGGGEPFLHKQLPEFIDVAMQYKERFGKLMLFSNCTLPLNNNLIETMAKHKAQLFVQLSRYGIKPEREEEFAQTIQNAEIPNRVRKYYGEDQSFGGWVSFGEWEKQNCSPESLITRFEYCAVTSVIYGNWRTRDGKVHWCSRSQRGMELGLIPDCPEDYIDLLSDSTLEEKRSKFEKIATSRYLSACDYCSGDQGTNDVALRFPAAEQLEGWMI